MTRSVFIVRHGNTFDKGDTVTRVGARTDLPLSGSGQTQVEQLAAHFAFTQPDGFAAVFASPLQRTQQTANAILAMQDHAPTIETLEFLREIDYGPDENLPEDVVVARIGAAALEAWEADATPPPGWQVDPSELIQAWRDLFTRIAQDRSDARSVLVVTSNGVARFALGAAAGADDHPLKLKTGAYGRIDVGPAGDAVVADWNVRP